MMPLVQAYAFAARYSLEIPNGNRSSKRTDGLHNRCVTWLVKYLDLSEEEWEISHEVRVPCARATQNNPKKTFCIDVLLTHRETEVKIYLLVKSIEKSYNKNKENFANTITGEVERLFGYSDHHKNDLADKRKRDIVVFLTLLPNKLLNGQKVEKVKYTYPHPTNLRKIHPNVHVLTVRIGVNQFSNFTEFVENIDNNLLDEEHVYEVMKQVGDNVEKSLQL